MKPLDLRIHAKHPTVDAYRFGPSYTPYAVVAEDKRFSDAELAAEYWAAALDADIMAPKELVAIAATILRLAELPHFDEADQ